jgi:hypothetical protein
MNRIYTDVSNFRAPYDNVMFAGLGEPKWPAGRSYWDTSNYRAPYDNGYFQDNSLYGLSADPTPPGAAVPPEAMPTGPRVPTWAWITGAAAAVAVVGYALTRRK